MKVKKLAIASVMFMSTMFITATATHAESSSVKDGVGCTLKGNFVFCYGGATWAVEKKKAVHQVATNNKHYLASRENPRFPRTQYRAPKNPVGFDPDLHNAEVNWCTRYNWWCWKGKAMGISYKRNR